MNSVQDGVVRVERHIQASPATVFSFFSSAERWVLWQGEEATIDLRPDGEFRMNVGNDQVVSGRFLEIVPSRRLVLTWGWEIPNHPVPPGSSTVEIDFLPDGDGTLLQVQHRDLPATSVERFRKGWEHYAGRLVVRAAGGDPGPDTPF